MRTRPKLPPARCRHHAEFGKLSPSPGRCVSGASAAVPPAQRVAVGVPPAGEAQRGPAVCAGARAQRGRRLGGGRAGAARRRRKPFQRRPPRLHGAGRARRLRPRISACRRGPDPQPECERVVSSGRRQWARSGGGCIFERGRAASSPGGALSGWPRQPEPRQTLKIAERSLGDLARRRPCRAESVERDHRPSAACWGAKGHLWPMSKAANSHSSL